MNRFPFFTYFSAAEAYRSILQSLVANPIEHTVRGEKMWSEIIGASILIQCADTLDMDVKARKQNKAYTYCEALWDMSGTTDVDILAYFQPGITRFVSDQDQQETAIWGYGTTVAQELPRMAHMLKESPDTRRAVFVMPRNPGLKGTPPCLVAMQFIVRDDKLNGVVFMRSNDVWLGFPLDVFQFGLMLRTVAGYLDMPVGSYTHNVGSLHLYSRDIEGARRVIASSRGDEEWLHMPKIPPSGIADISLGGLHSDLKKTCLGEDTPEGPYSYYLKFMKEYMVERLSIKQ